MEALSIILRPLLIFEQNNLSYKFLVTKSLLLAFLLQYCKLRGKFMRAILFLCCVESNYRFMFLSDWQTCIISKSIIPWELGHLIAIILSILIAFHTEKSDS